MLKLVKDDERPHLRILTAEAVVLSVGSEIRTKSNGSQFVSCKVSSPDLKDVSNNWDELSAIYTIAVANPETGEISNRDLVSVGEKVTIQVTLDTDPESSNFNKRFYNIFRIIENDFDDAIFDKLEAELQAVEG